MLTRLIVLICAIILANNFIGSYQYKLSKSYGNRPAGASVGQGQGEYYVPSYANRLEQPTYQELLLAENLAAERALAAEREEQAAVEEQFPRGSFPSIVRPSISLNGPDRFSKYKQAEVLGADEDEAYQPAEGAADSNVMSGELRRWLANIRAMQPVVDDRLDAIGDYIKAASRQYQQRQQQQQQNQQQASNRILNFQQQQQPSLDVEEAESSNYYPETAANVLRHFEEARLQQQQQQQQQKQVPSISRLSPYAAEAMMDTNSYDDLQEATAGGRLEPFEKKRSSHESVPARAADSSAHNEPKARRKLANSGEPSSLLQSKHNVVLSPKALYTDSAHQSRHQQSSSSSSTSLLSSLSDVYFVAIVACVSSVAIFSVIGAGYCFYKVQQSNKAAADVEFPSYGVIGPANRDDGKDGSTGGDGRGSASLVSASGAKCSSPPADRKLAQSAQMYHYHHQKQQMISNEKNANTPRHNNAANSDVESDEENEDGEYTVYECPGLAPTGEMEVKNPLFQDDLTPMSSPSVNGTAAAASKESPKTATTTTSGKSETAKPSKSENEK